MNRGRDYILAILIGAGAFAIAAFWPRLADMAGIREDVPGPVLPDEPDAGDPPVDPPAEDPPGSGDPEPADPEPTDPEPADPEPADPEPTDPEPTDPEPTDPEPADPDPGDPGPGDPGPGDPAPTEPEPEILTDWLGDEFSYMDPGDLIPGSGEGQSDPTIYAPGIRFPVELPRAFANSQVYRPGGIEGGGGWQCDASNYSYPWRDNFCETRGFTTPFCPAGTGHQGQDIRPPRCPPSTPDDQDDFYAVATADGDITGVNGHVVSLLADDGSRYLYLHLEPTSLLVETGDRVARGDRIGIISNYYGSTPTTYHLHFEIRQSVMLDGEIVQTPVPPYTSLVDAYERLLAGEEGDFPPPPGG